ncbi:hypothetical protein LCGC14_2482490 [marine sediment metagenome]|uniref:Uncharacterized protein n=1 Tax=marine sediment metagenome TaxID=412755 RepID=A0A0F9DJ71_9ZZZZ
MTTNDGGPAFPGNFACINVEGLLDDARNFGFAESGMSLRDWYAGLAMQTLMNPSTLVAMKNELECLDRSTTGVLALLAFEAANSMLAARKREEREEPGDG